MTKEKDHKRVIIIGGGISGVTSAIELAKNGINVDLYEKRNCLLRGSPYCHLHAGGVLYPDISLKDGQELLYDSLQFAKEFSDCLNYRPTIVAYRVDSTYCPNRLVLKCKVNKLYYKQLTGPNSSSCPLGSIENYYAVYTFDDIKFYKKYGKLPKTEDPTRQYHNSYVEKFCKLLGDIWSIKYPFVSVCEPGIDQNKVENKLLSELNKYKEKGNLKVYLNKQIDLNETKNDKTTNTTIINATNSVIFENNYKQQLEWKASWIIQTCLKTEKLPEIAIIGERETERGMIQLTPIYGGTKFQVHCMRSDSSIIKTTEITDINKLNNIIKNKLTTEEIQKRGQIAINEAGKLFPIFNQYMSRVIEICDGVQIINGNSKSKRISNVYYKTKNKNKIDMIDNKIDMIDNEIYAIEILTMKAGSVITISKKVKDIVLRSE